MKYEPFENSDLILQRVLLPLERLLVDDLDSVHLSVLATLSQPHLGEGSPEMTECILQPRSLPILLSGLS